MMHCLRRLAWGVLTACAMVLVPLALTVALWRAPTPRGTPVRLPPQPDAM